MRKLRVLVSLVCASMIPFAGYFLFARTGGCEESREPDVLSPNGQQVAAASMKACPAGFLSSTNPSVFVNLRHGGTPTSKATLVFQLDDAAEPPTLTWTSGNELTVKLNDTGQVEVAKLESQGTKIHYTVPSWMLDRLGGVERTRLSRNRESEALYKTGRISEADFRGMSRTNDAVAQEQESFREWVSANASVENASSNSH